MRNHLRMLCLVGAVSTLGIFTSSCNMTGAVDTPKEREEIIEEAKIMMEDGRCTEAATKLDGIAEKTDESRKLHGWALMCMAGATVDKISKSLFSYDSTANNLNIIGALANNLIPMSTEKIALITSAAGIFNNLDNSDDRALNQSIAQVVKSAAVLARRSQDGVRIRRADVYLNSSCINASCAGAPASCGEGMPDADATELANALTAASNLVSGLSQLGAARTLAQQLGAGVGAVNITRCFVVNSLLAD